MFVSTVNDDRIFILSLKKEQHMPPPAHKTCKVENVSEMVGETLVVKSVQNIR